MCGRRSAHNGGGAIVSDTLAIYPGIITSGKTSGFGGVVSLLRTETFPAARICRAVTKHDLELGRDVQKIGT